MQQSERRLWFDTRRSWIIYRRLPQTSPEQGLPGCSTLQWIVADCLKNRAVTVTVYLTPCQRPSEGRLDAGNAIRPPPKKGVK